MAIAKGNRNDSVLSVRIAGGKKIFTKERCPPSI